MRDRSVPQLVAGAGTESVVTVPLRLCFVVPRAGRPWASSPVAERAPGPVPRAVVDVGLTANGRGAPQSGSRAMFRGVGVPPLTLEDGDSVVVDLITGGDRSLFVTIAGMVRKPGVFPWREGITLRDLVTLARGPIVGADLREAEIARLPEDRSTGQLAQTMRVSLDSSYLFERDTAGAYLGAAGVAFPAAGSAPEVTLEPYDRVTIFQQPQFELQRSRRRSGSRRASPCP